MTVQYFIDIPLSAMCIRWIFSIIYCLRRYCLLCVCYEYSSVDMNGDIPSCDIYVDIVFGTEEHVTCVTDLLICSCMIMHRHSLPV